MTAMSLLHLALCLGVNVSSPSLLDPDPCYGSPSDRCEMPAPTGDEGDEAVVPEGTKGGITVQVLSQGNTAIFLVTCPDGRRSVIHPPPGGWPNGQFATFKACGSVIHPPPGGWWNSD